MMQWIHKLCILCSLLATQSAAAEEDFNLLFWNVGYINCRLVCSFVWFKE